LHPDSSIRNYTLQKRESSIRGRASNSGPMTVRSTVIAIIIGTLLIIGLLAAVGLVRSTTSISPHITPVPTLKTENRAGDASIETPRKLPINEFPHSTGPDLPTPSISAESYLLVNLSNSSTVLGKQVREIKSIASITKLVTAVVALRLGDKQDLIVVSGHASMQPPTKMGLLKNDRVTIGDLLAGLLLDSGNDAAKALEEGLGGSTLFLREMNRLAENLGMTNTMFDNAAGYDSSDNYSTAYDLALLARHIIFNEPEIMEIVGSERISIESNDGHGWFGPQNMNRLITEYEGAIGLKTGETDDAGLSLLAAAKKGDTIMVAVVLSSQNHFDDARILLDYGFTATKQEY